MCIPILIPQDQNNCQNCKIWQQYWKMAANSEKMEIEIGSIANMFWYIMNYQYAHFGTLITN